MIQKKFIPIIFFVGLVIVAIGYNDHKKTQDREPQGVVDFFKSKTNNFIHSVYDFKDNVKEKVVDTALKGATKVAKIYLNKLPLEEGVKQRLDKYLSNEEFIGVLVPFVLSLKDQYVLPKDFSSQHSFETYARKHFSNIKNDKSFGTEHEYFKWDKAVEKEKDGGGPKMSQAMIIALIGVVDVLLLENDFAFKLNDLIKKPYKRITVKDQATIDKLGPKLKGILGQVFAPAADKAPGKEEKGANSVIIDSIDNILKDKNKFEAVIISLIDFVRMTVQKNYRSFAIKAIKEQQYIDWAHEKIDSNKIEELKNEIDYQLNDKRYGVHVVVDGLQGELMRSLAMGPQESPFLKATKVDFDNREKFIPKGESFQTLTGNHKNNFLQHIVEKPYDSKYYLSYFKNIYTKYNSSIANMGISTTPTISVRNLPIAKTGAKVSGPGGTGVPNFHFVDREKDRAYYFYGNDALLLEELTAESNMKSIFERLISFNTLNCNAQYDWYAQDTFEPLVNLGVGEKVRDLGEMLCLNKLKKSLIAEKEVNKKRKDLIEQLNLFLTAKTKSGKKTYKKRAKNIISEIASLQQKAIPQYLLIYNPWPDHFAHFVGPVSDEIISPTGELNRLDYWLQKVSDVYKEAGVEARTLFGMAGDHGLSPIFYVLNPEVEVLKKLEKDLAYEVIVKKISSDEGEGPKINHALNPESNKGIDVIVASTAGGNFMMDFFHQDNRWKQHPTYAELKNWKFINSAESIDVISQITNRLKNSLEYLVVRENLTGPNKTHIRLIAHRNGKLFEEEILRDGNKIFYGESEGELLSQASLSRYRRINEPEARFISLRKKCIEDATKTDQSSWCSSVEWRELSLYTDKPDAVVQMAHLYDEKRAGTINLFPKYGVGYNTKVPGRHAGESFAEKDSFAGVWGLPTSSNKTNLKSADIGSIPATIYRYITGQEVNKGVDGWGYKPLLDKAINK